MALCRAVEKSGKIYMLAENYPYTAFNQEMRRLYRAGEIGEVTYAEGEYNHPMAPRRPAGASRRGMNHWRNWLPSTYYCTHALAPLMYITDTHAGEGQRPVHRLPRGRRAAPCARSDPGSVILCRMDNGAVFRIFGLLLPGHSNWYRLHGTRGAMEITRGPGYFGPGQVRVWHEEWDRQPGEPAERTYVPDWPEHGDLARAGRPRRRRLLDQLPLRQRHPHRRAALPGRLPRRGHVVASASWPGRARWRTAGPFDVPDFRRRGQPRAPTRTTTGRPGPKDAGPGQPPPSILGTPEPTEEGIAAAREVWRERGYAGE